MGRRSSQNPPKLRGQPICPACKLLNLWVRLERSRRTAFPAECRRTPSSLEWIQFQNSVYYLPAIRIENEPDTMGPRAGRPPGRGGALAGGGPNSAVMVST